MLLQRHHTLHSSDICLSPLLLLWAASLFDWHTRGNVQINYRAANKCYSKQIWSIEFVQMLWLELVNVSITVPDFVPEKQSEQAEKLTLGLG